MKSKNRRVQLIKQLKCNMTIEQVEDLSDRLKEVGINQILFDNILKLYHNQEQSVDRIIVLTNLLEIMINEI